MLKITHTPRDGTLLEGTVRGDGAWEAIKAAQAKYRIRGWKYMPSIQMIGVGYSRDRAPKLLLIDETAQVLREAGFEVTIDVECRPRAMEDAEADRAEHMDERAEALTAKAARKLAEANTRNDAAQEILDGIPAGQPILAGHHSERHHRRDLARADSHLRTAIQLDDEAARAEHYADTAQRHMDLREDPGVVSRRLDTLTAERRRVQRSLDGYTRNHRDGRGEIFYVEDHPAVTGRARVQCLAEAADLNEKIRYWTSILDDHKANGRWCPMDPSVISKGDEIRCGGHGWHTVLRVNTKTVTVAAPWEGGRLKVGLEKITGHHKASDVAQAVTS